jgi:hypothetical protein
MGDLQHSGEARHIRPLEHQLWGREQRKEYAAQ